MRIKLISIVIFIPIFLITSSFSQQKAEWKGTIEYEDGVKVIKNPNEPLYGEINLDLEEDLSIGNEDDENYLFFRAVGIGVDEKGNIYVVDSGNQRVQKFDKKGNYLLTIGKEGQGPGELNSPFRIQIDDDTRKVYVNDRLMKVIIFDQDGKYLDEDITFGEGLLDFFIDSDGNVLGKFFGPGHRALQKIETEEKTEKKIVEFPFGVNIQKLGSTRVGNRIATRVVGGTHGYEFDLFLSQINKETFIYGYSKEYELFVIDKEGSVLFKIKKDVPRQRFSSELKNRIEFQSRMQAARRGQTVPSDYSFDFPEYFPFFYSIFMDSSGRIWVRTEYDDRENKNNGVYDVFSQDGYYLHQVNFPVRPRLIKDGYLYTITLDEETGSECIKRYKIKNWDSIKTGFDPKQDEFK